MTNKTDVNTKRKELDMCAVHNNINRTCLIKFRIKDTFKTERQIYI